MYYSYIQSLQFMFIYFKVSLELHFSWHGTFPQLVKHALLTGCCMYVMTLSKGLVIMENIVLSVWRTTTQKTFTGRKLLGGSYKNSSLVLNLRGPMAPLHGFPSSAPYRNELGDLHDCRQWKWGDQQLTKLASPSNFKYTFLHKFI